MKREEYIKKRAIRSGEHIVNTGDTIRRTAEIIGCSKTTVYNDLNRLNKLNKGLYKEVRKNIEKNIDERAIRGGLATKKKLEEKKRGKSNGNKL